MLADGTNQYYLVNLELSVKGVSQVSSGNPGKFPAPPGCQVGNVALVQWAQATATGVVLTGDPIDGNILYWFVAARTAANTYLPATGSWTLIDAESCEQNTAGDYPIKIYYKLVEQGDVASWPVTQPSGAKAWMVEFSGQLVFDVTAGASAVNNADPVVSLTPTPGKVSLLVSLVDQADDTGAAPHFSPAGGMTELVEDFAGGPWTAINYQIVAATSGSYTVGSTWGSHHPFANLAVIGAAFYCSAAGTGADNPPSPGRWIYDEIPTPPPGGGNRTFYTAFPYADGSLAVKVDNTRQTVTETDPANRRFDLAFDPRSFETILVSYQGR